MKELSPADFCAWQEEEKDFVLVDVREEAEHAAYNIGGELIPLGELMGHTASLPKDKPVVLYCEKGIRSIIAIQRLELLGFHNLYNLAGGMKAWKALQQ